MGIFFRDPQIDRIEAVVDGIATSTRNLLAATARIEKNQENSMSKTEMMHLAVSPLRWYPQ